MRRVRSLVPAFAILAVTSCAPGATACTMIGCDDGWNVELIGGTLPAAYTVQVRVDGQVAAAVECGPTNPCARTMFLPGITAEQAELEIIGADLNLRWVVTPTYQTFQPNGPNCPPTCRQARVQVQLSARPADVQPSAPPG
jgi:hypothetical protein